MCCATSMQVADVKLATLVTCVGGAADTGRHIVDYSRRQDADVVLMGSRGMGSLRRAMLGLLGLGSVSSYGESASPRCSDEGRGLNGRVDSCRDWGHGHFQGRRGVGPEGTRLLHAVHSPFPVKP